MPTCSGAGACQHAVSLGCECGCGGANHGARVRIAWAIAYLAGEPTPEQIRQRAAADKARAKAEEELRKRTRIRRNSSAKKLPTTPDAKWFFETARSIEIVDWLVANPAEVDQMHWMVTKVGEICDQVLETNSRSHKRLADHFWCDTIAAIVEVLDSFVHQVDEDFATTVADLTWEKVRQSRNNSCGNRPTTRKLSTVSRLRRDVTVGLAEAALKKACEDLTKALLAPLSIGVHGALDPLILKLRILAILLCPDPDAHKAVWEYCWLPLLKDQVIMSSEEYMNALLPLFQQKWSWRQ